VRDAKSNVKTQFIIKRQLTPRLVVARGRHHVWSIPDVRGVRYFIESFNTTDHHSMRALAHSSCASFRKTKPRAGVVFNPPRESSRSVALCSLGAGSSELISTADGRQKHLGRDHLGTAQQLGVNCHLGSLLDDQVGTRRSHWIFTEGQHAMVF